MKGNKGEAKPVVTTTKKAGRPPKARNVQAATSTSGGATKVRKAAGRKSVSRHSNHATTGRAAGEVVPTPYEDFLGLSELERTSPGWQPADIFFIGLMIFVPLVFGLLVGYLWGRK